MKSIGFYFVVVLYFGAHFIEADINFTLLGATSATYKQFIKNLRTTLTVGSPIVESIPVLKPNASGSASFLLVDLTNYNGESITVAFNVTNVYVTAYRAGNTAYFLNDTSPEAYSVLFQGITHVTLPYGGNYNGLERAAGNVLRENIFLGFSEMSSAIESMFYYTTGTSVPKAFIVIIESISEAARFKYIEKKVSENVETVFLPDPAFISLENKWSKLCKQIQIAQTQGGKFARPVIVISVNNNPIIVDNVSSPVVKGIALLLYYDVDDVGMLLSRY